MIEDKELGLKVAENEDDKFWHEFQDRLSKDNINMERQIEINKIILNYIENKIKEMNK